MMPTNQTTLWCDDIGENLPIISPRVPADSGGFRVAETLGFYRGGDM